jgi:2,3-bisphosphoglycerate-independent phosphoglycerate mutase
MMGQPIEPNLPQGEGESRLRQLIWDSREILEDHEINRRRRDEGRNPANMIWLWGQGRDPNLPSFALKHQVTGAVIAAVDLIRGIARCAGLAAPEVPGATGNLETDFAAKGRAVVKALEEFDFVLCHVEAPDEAGHHGDIEKKIWAIEQVDRQVVGPVMEALEGRPDHRVLVLPDHPTPIAVRTHTRTPVPFAIFGTGIAARGADVFSEAAAAATGLVIDEGHRLMDEFLSPG